MKRFTSLRKVSAITMAIFAVNALFAEDSVVLNPKTTDEWTRGGKNVTAIEGEKALAIKGDCLIISKEASRIDPGKSYKLSGYFKQAPDSSPSRFYLGILPIDSQGRHIAIECVNLIAGTETELVADCSPGDTVIKIKNGEKWKPDIAGHIAFNVDNCGQKTDLPNFELSSRGITKIEKKGDIYEVTLANRCGQKYTAGTNVRMHLASGGTYMYLAAANKEVPTDWQEFSAIFKKASCWTGTCAAKIIILANNSGTPDQVMLIKDIKIEEVK